MEPIPILLVVSRLHIGGNERDLAKLARYLRRDRYEPHVAAFDVTGDRRAELDAGGVPVLHLPVNSFMNRTVLDGGRRLYQYVRKRRIRVVHAFDAPTSIFAAPLARVFGVEAVVSNHCYFRDLLSRRHYHLLRIVDRAAHRIVVNAEALKAHLAQFGVERERIFLSHNGLDTREFFPAPVERPEFLKGASLVIGALAVLREEKRIDVLLDAFARVLPSDTRMRLLVVGTGDMRESLLRRRSELGLDETCHFVPTTADVPQWMRMMDIYVLPSRSEGFPNTLLEAMGCGCAVVASNVGGVPDLVEHGRNGLLSAPADPGDVARQLTVLIRDPDLRKRMGERAAADARTSFSMEAAARRIESLYDSMLSETRPIGSTQEIQFPNRGLSC